MTRFGATIRGRSPNLPFNLPVFVQNNQTVFDNLRKTVGVCPFVLSGERSVSIAWIHRWNSPVFGSGTRLLNQKSPSLQGRRGRIASLLRPTIDVEFRAVARTVLKESVVIAETVRRFDPGSFCFGGRNPGPMLDGYKRGPFAMPGPAQRPRKMRCR